VNAPIRQPYHRSRHRIEWTREENSILTREWGEVCPRVLMSKLPGRTWTAILIHAKDGLHLPMGVPQGEVSLTEAARRLGFHSAITVRKLAKRHGIAIRLHPRPASTGVKTCGRRCVEWDAIRDACAEETRHVETVRAAAEARGLSGATLWRWLRDAGVLPPRGEGEAHRSRGFLRVASADVDRVVAERLPAHRAYMQRRGAR
jgi:hypothetical protein